LGRTRGGYSPWFCSLVEHVALAAHRCKRRGQGGKRTRCYRKATISRCRASAAESQAMSAPTGASLPAAPKREPMNHGGIRFDRIRCCLGKLAAGPRVIRQVRRAARAIWAGIGHGGALNVAQSHDDNLIPNRHLCFVKPSPRDRRRPSFLDLEWS
jgi:hypothetical protein